MNNHLNLFKFYNETYEKIIIENNLTRALTICFKNNGILLSNFLNEILDIETHQSIYESRGEEELINIDIQIDLEKIEHENYSKVFAVALCQDDLNLNEFLTKTSNNKYAAITDIFVNFRDIAIIIEVKLNSENCADQLFSQASTFRKGNQKCKIIPISYSWKKIIKLFERIKNAYRFHNEKSIFIEDFLLFAETNFPNWFESTELSNFNHSIEFSEKNRIQAEKRLRIILSETINRLGNEYSLITTSNRSGIKLPFKSTSELIPLIYFDKTENQNKFSLNIWPANTKYQGNFVYKKNLDWTNLTFISINGKSFPLKIKKSMNFSHFMGKSISFITFEGDDLKKELHTLKNYKELSGKWELEEWGNFENKLDEIFQEKFDWRTKTDWLNNFKNTDRKYLFFSFGYEISIIIPFAYIKDLDRPGNSSEMMTFLLTSIDSIKNLLE